MLTEGLIGSFRAGLAGLPSRITGEMALRAQIETACDEMLTRLADDAQKKSKVLLDGQSLIEDEAEADDADGADDEHEKEEE